MPASRKRVRATAPPVPPAPLNAVALRAAIASRSGAEALPAAWRAVAAAAGVSNADAFLSHHGRSIVDALRALSAAAEAARAELRSIRTALHAAVDSRCDELEEKINDAETSKTAALERELCAVDVSLERWRAERDAIAAEASTLNDVDLAARHAELTARLDAAEADLLTLPTSIVEPAHVTLVTDAPALLADIAACGRVVAPCPVLPTDLTLEGVPLNLPPGCKLHLHLVLRQPTHASQSEAELEVTLGALAAAVRVEAVLVTAGAPTRPLETSIALDASRRCITISVAVPDDPNWQADASVRIDSVIVSGQPIVTRAGLVCIPVRLGVQVPVVLKWMDDSDAPEVMCISRVGNIYVAQDGSPVVVVYDPGGEVHHYLSEDSMGLTSSICKAACTDDYCGATIFLSGNDFTSPRLVSANSRVRWATSVKSSVGGLAVLRGVCIVALDDSLVAHSISDGKIVARLEISEQITDLAADPASGKIFGSFEPYRNTVACYSFTPKAGFRAEGIVAAAGNERDECALAVVPPAPGKRVSHLVVGSVNASELRVLALPGLSLVHKHTLEDMEIRGVAADPWGRALAVSDGVSNSIHVLPWPLPGMPVLA